MTVPLYNTNIRQFFFWTKKIRFTKTRPYEIVRLQLKRFGFFKTGSEGIDIYLKKKQELCITVKYILMVDFSDKEDLCSFRSTPKKLADNYETFTKYQF